MSNLASSSALNESDDQWRDDALCRNTDPELFFPVGRTGTALISIDHAKQVCSECGVVQACLDFALDTNQDSGVWGGLSEDERRSVRRKRAADLKASKG
ncbi:MAG: WhiB family transcriptional regulator [Ilumatobacter coccineus]|uniref:Transcriptional regulator WhiB n=1 Tax=Ilumatobacter coccineus TaxID=467094 RepID=A0A2G6K8P4_9ACTN|nr:MAG: WhiB family transcriptional regulator [Ilumatobacter coccineus]